MLQYSPLDTPAASAAEGLHYSLLDQALIRARLVDGGQQIHYTLPDLLAALTQDAVRDFPALRPHQRHPWHAFLVQLAAIALHHAGQSQPFTTASAWKAALLALTPDHPNGAAWCLISPHDQPAFMQAPVPDGKISDWKNTLAAPDELDMLVTSKNHDLKAARMQHALPDDWMMALMSLQTQEGFLGSGNYGISRMNGGFANRPAIGAMPQGNWGRRWQRDVAALLKHRDKTVAQMELQSQNGIALLWVKPWDGESSLAFAALDPFYIEICRRIRLTPAADGKTMLAITTGSKAARVDAKTRNGITGDPWMPIDPAAGKALTIGADGFHYKLAAELVFGSKYRHPITQEIEATDGTAGIMVLAQGIARGQGKTEGYHERRIPISPKVRNMLRQKQTDPLAKIAGERVNAIAKIRGVLWTGLSTLFDQGAAKDKFSDSAKDKAARFTQSFEHAEDTRFFDELNIEIESDDPENTRLQWILSMADRAEVILKNAFVAGPQSGERRYRAQSAALSRFHGGLRSDKTLPTLANYYRQLTQETEHEPV
ncbi:MAG: type I-E CRISPR-associated protein Cse1/CasA [Gallionella sp.]